MIYDTIDRYPLWIYCLISELSSSGRKGSYIAIRTGWSVDHTKRVARYFGYKLPRENGMNEDERTRLIELWSLGMSDGSIAKRLHIGKRTAGRWREICGLRPNFAGVGSGYIVANRHTVLEEFIND